MAITASLALLMVCIFGCNLISIWVVVLVNGSTMKAPRTGLPVISAPPVYVKSDGLHAGWKCCNGVWSDCMGG